MPADLDPCGASPRVDSRSRDPGFRRPRGERLGLHRPQLRCRGLVRWKTTEDVRRMIAQVVDEIGQVRTSRSRSIEPPADTLENSNNSNAIETTDEKAEPSGNSEPTDQSRSKSPAQDVGNQVLLQSNTEDIASQHDVTEAEEKPKQFVTSRPWRRAASITKV